MPKKTNGAVKETGSTSLGHKGGIQTDPAVNEIKNTLNEPSEETAHPDRSDKEQKDAATSSESTEEIGTDYRARQNIGGDREKEPEEVSKTRERKDAEIILAARKYEKLTKSEHERLRFIGQKDLWVKQELKYGEQVDVHIPLAPGEQIARKSGKDGRTAYPMEYTSIEGVKVWVPKGRTVPVPKIVADVLSGYIKSLYPVHHEMQNLSNPSFGFDM